LKKSVDGFADFANFSVPNASAAKSASGANGAADQNGSGDSMKNF